MKNYFLFFIAILLLAGSLPAQLESLLDNTELKLQESVEQLAEARRQIASEKLPLASQQQQLLTELESLRRDAERALRLSDSRESSLSELRNNVQVRNDNIDYISNLLSEFTNVLEGQLVVPERNQIDKAIAAATAARGSSELERSDVIQSQIEIINLAVNRASDIFGVRRLKGQAITPAGLLADGTYVFIGPFEYFISSDASIAGISEKKGLGASVTVIENAIFDEGIDSIASGSSGSIPYDPTLGNALAVAEVDESFFEHIQKGGFWIYPILFFALVSFSVAIFKAVELATIPKAKKGALASIIEPLAAGDKPAALAAANAIPGPMGSMLNAGIRHYEQDEELVEEIMYEHIVETQPKVMRLLPFISVTAAVSPLLGLLGTVTGMINTFNMIKVFGTGDAKSLSGGISEALVTTEFGLIVAIPSLLAYAILSRVAKGYLGQMEKLSISFLNVIKPIKNKVDGNSSDRLVADASA